jgi:hypothetical protein
MPFPFYNTAPPTPSTKNNITDIAVIYGIRDFLLNRNLAPVYPYLSTAINGSPRIGEPVLDTSINGDANVIPLGLPLEVEGISRYNIAIAINQFKNDQPTAPSLINIENVVQSQGVFGSVDFPNGIQSYPTSATQQVSEYGLLGKTAYAGFRKSATLFNLYLDSTKQIDAGDFISLQPAGFTQQVTGYADQYGGLNLGNSQSGIQAASVIGSLLNGQGLGLAKGGVVTNFDMRSSLAGRVLGATGAFNDTKLGMIGGQQLALALANNAAFNVQQDILGSLNVQDNVLALVKGGPLPGLRPNYQITVPSSTGGKIADYTEKVLGFTIPRSYLTDAGSIFTSEYSSGNIDRANAMIQNTGKGQNQALITNVISNINGTGQYDNPNTTEFRSGYIPGYKNNKGELAVNPTLYAFYDDATKGTILNFIAHSDSLIPEISFNRSDMIKKYGFFAPEDTGTGPKGNSGYNKRKISNVGFTWTSTNGEAVNSNVISNEIAFPDELPSTVIFDGTEYNQKKSLLYKTQKLFNSKGMLNIVTAKGDMNKISTQIQTASGGGFSKGSGVLNQDVYAGGYQAIATFNTPENTYCRSWTTLDRYDKVYNLVRRSGLKDFSEKLPYRFNLDVNDSTLESAGFVKIAPYVDEFGNADEYRLTSPIEANPKNYMFSIENLAWHDSENMKNLLPVEQGPGDLITRVRGRIMWFPPYDIQFSESTSVNWESTNFIGRGEPVYTYNNTERSGNLSFKIIVDHSSYVNAFGDSAIQADDNYVASFFAGCVQPDSEVGKRLTISQKSAGAQLSNEATPKKTFEPFGETDEMKFSIYYPNDNYVVSDLIALGYENGLDNNYRNGNSSVGTTPVESPGDGYGIGQYQGKLTRPRDSSGNPKTNADFKTYTDNTNFGLNGVGRYINGVQYLGISSDISSNDYYTALEDFLEKTCKECYVKIKSYASPQGYVDDNKKLADARTNSAFEYLKSKLPKLTSENRIRPDLGSHAFSDADYEFCKRQTKGTDSGPCKVARSTDITFETDDPNLYPKEIVEAPVVEKKATSTERVNVDVVNQLYDESRYFTRIKDTDPLVFDAFKDRIKYFNPAFHSMTPEGLNSRLTFLQQCTRQGPTLEAMGGSNLAFGRAPVCILRIGDFYNTKIIIDSLSVDYEPLVWDLNPEGIGVQPMIANVTLSFKFVGGSSLKGPIDMLQNALSFNYYANTHVYDPRANYIEKAKNTGKDENGNDLPAYQIMFGSPISNYITVPNPPPVTNAPESNQIANAEIATGPESAQPTADAPPASVSTTPAITGFKYVEIQNIGGNNYTVTVVLNQTGIYKNENGGTTQLLTDEELKTFMSKGVRLTLEKTPTPISTSRVEEVITDANITKTDGKCVQGCLFAIGYQMGSEPNNGGFNVKDLVGGLYSLSVYYDGKIKGKIGVNLGDVKFQYFG